MRQTRKLRGGATPSQIRANQTRSSSKSGRRLSRKRVKDLYGAPAAEYIQRIKKEAAEDAEALEEMDRKIRNEEKLERKKKKRETNKILAGLFSGLKIK
jgi:hypothetical protein